MEEKEIFKILKKACILDENCYEVDCLLEEDLEAIRELVKRYEKQQKEIEEYKSGDFFTAKQMHRIDEDYIDKVKIIGKIEELEKLPQNQYIYLRGVIDEFKKLLEG